jgi:glycosyltransferase involved in cell wall biosynthesis
MSELIHPGECGLHFRSGDPEDLARVVMEAFARPTDLARMRAGARAMFDAQYTAGISYDRLIEIYAGVRETCRFQHPPSPSHAERPAEPRADGAVVP